MQIHFVEYLWKFVLQYFISQRSRSLAISIHTKSLL